MDTRLENLIDTLIKTIDEDIFNLHYSYKKSPYTEEVVDGNRDVIRDILETLIDDSDLLNAMRKVGVEEDWDGFETALKIYGKPYYE